MSDDVFRWVIAAGVLLACASAVWQAVILTMLARAGKEAQKAGKEAQNKIGPIVERFEAVLTTASKILDENRPRIADITAETLLMAKTARQEIEQIRELIDDASARAKARIAQIDETVSHTVEEVEHASEAVKSAVLKPVKEVNGLVAGVKAALNTFAQGGRRNSPENVTQDEEMFI